MKIQNIVFRRSNGVFIRLYTFLQVTGIRCGTARKLSWKNMFLDEEKPYYSIEAEQNKVKKRLNVPISRDFANWLKEIKSKHEQFCDQNGIKFTSNIHLFSCLYIYKSHKEGRPAAEIIPLQIAKQRGKIFLKVVASMILKLVATIRCFTVSVIRKLQI